MNGMQWTTDPDGNPDTDDFPRVVSNSWGGPLGTHWVEIMNTWHAMGIAPVFAAGIVTSLQNRWCSWCL